MRVFKTIKKTTALNYFGKEAAFRCKAFKNKPMYKTYFDLCIEGLAGLAGYYVSN